MNYTLSTLPPKFRPYVLGSAQCSAPPGTKEAIDAVFTQPLISLKGNYIFDVGNWVLKLNRTDGIPATEDSFLYRVRKAEKLRRHIQQNGLQNDLVVPQKFLYWHETQHRFYVVSQKIDLSSDVVQPTKEAHDAYKAFPKDAIDQIGGQFKSLLTGIPTQRPLTPLQAKGLAELAVLGYTDQSYNNVFFTRDGKVAIIDTEPVKRLAKKKVFQSKVWAWLWDKGFLKAQHTLTGLAKLKGDCSDPLALKEVEKVEKKHVLWSIAKLVAKIAIVALLFTAIVSAINIFSISGIALFGLAIPLAAFTSKILVLMLNIASIMKLWSLSHQGIQGVGQIALLEMGGYC